MARYFSFLLIVFRLTGIYSISTISKVSMKAGHSLTVPCYYEHRYRDNVKYLCKGSWFSCSYVVKTNQPDKSGKFSISDDKIKRIFTVTINRLGYHDSELYWCAVEINNGADDGKDFYLSNNRGEPTLSVGHQELTGFIGDSVTIQCHSTSRAEIKWCRLEGSCARVSSKSIDGTKLDIHTSSSGFTVTMSGLTTASGGWYYCVKGDLQMPVHLTVTEKPTTTTLSPTTHHTTAREEQTFTTFRPEQQRNGTVDLKSLIIPLSLLIFIVMTTLIIWLILKKHKQRKMKSSATVMAEEEVTYSDVKHKSKTSVEPGSDVIYSNVVYGRETSDQMSRTDVDVTYSSVVIKTQQSAKQD